MRHECVVLIAQSLPLFSLSSVMQKFSQVQLYFPLKPRVSLSARVLCGFNAVLPLTVMGVSGRVMELMG